MALKIFELVKKNVDIVILLFVIILAVSQRWIGVWSMLIFYFAFIGYRIYKVWKIMKPFTNDGVVADFGRMWETEQLGYDLDNPYWEGKKRPTILQKIKGINPNMTEEENRLRHLDNAKIKEKWKQKKKKKKANSQKK
jgi:hypothetical protein